MPKRITLSTTPPSSEGPTCLGTYAAYGRFKNHGLSRDPHVAAKPSWGVCWKCKRSLGCSACTTSSAVEVLCEICAAWGTKAAFHHHGPLVSHPKKQFRVTEYLEYPEEWRRGYIGVASRASFNTEALVNSLAGEKNSPVRTLNLRGVTK